MTADTAHPERRSQKRSADARDRLMDAALVEFAAHGFDGASTRAIAERAGMHQPQINYHFDSKDELWRATADRLLRELEDRLLPVITEAAGDDRRVIEAVIRTFVDFAADRPELNRIMVQEVTTDSDRLDWLVDNHIQRAFDGVTTLWSRLADEGEVPAIDPTIFYYLLVGGASFLYVAAPEARRLSGLDAGEADVRTAHADALVRLLLGETDD